MTETEPMRSLRTGLRVLLQFERAQRDMGVTEIAARCNLSKSQVSKILAAFVDAGLLVQDRNSRSYSVALRSFVLGSRFTTHDTLCQAATPIMRELLNRTHHSVHLSVPYGDRSLYLIGLEGPMFIDTGWHSGQSVAVGASSAGRVMMAYAKVGRREYLMGLPVPRLTHYTVCDQAALEQLVSRVATDGYCTQRNEISLGLGVTSVPLFATDRTLVGVLSLAFPAHHVASTEETGMVAELHAAARAISQRLGSGVYPYGPAALHYGKVPGTAQASDGETPVGKSR